MTYGWAILVVLAAIGALAYFGVLDAGQFAQERCTVGANFDCTDNVIEGDNTVRFALTNIGQESIDLYNVSVSGDCQDAATNTTEVTLAPRGEPTGWYAFECSNTFSPGSTYNINIDVRYQLESDTQAVRSASGSMVARP